MTCSLPPKRPSLVEIGSLYAFKPCGPPFSARGRVVPLVLTLIVLWTIWGTKVPPSPSSREMIDALQRRDQAEYEKNAFCSSCQEEYRVKTIERRFQQLLLDILM